MRILNYLWVAVLPILWCFALPMADFQISGSIEGGESGSAVILYTFHPVTQKKTEVAKTTLSDKGTYTLTYPFEAPELYRLENGSKSVVFVVDQGQAAIQIDIKESGIQIEGSPDAELLLGYEEFRKESSERLIQPAYEAMKASTKAGSREGEVMAVELYANNSEIHRKELLDYTEQTIGTSVALYGTVLRWTGDEEIARLEKLVAAFDAAHPGLAMTEVMQAKIERYKQVTIGAKAPAISLADTSGQVQQLEELMGKYTLIDFWASWCSPCLLQVPDLKQAYDAYQEQGFQIIGVSVDTKADRWKTAIDKYEMNWPHLSDLEGWNSSAANAYNVTFLPFNFLIGPDGTIIAKNLHHLTLQNKLKELLSN